MNDTKKEMFLLQYYQRNKNLSSSEVLELTKSKVSQVTIKRYLSALTQQGYLNQLGAGRSIKYVITKKGLLLRSFNVSEYLALTPTKDLVAQTIGLIFLRNRLWLYLVTMNYKFSMRQLLNFEVSRSGAMIHRETKSCSVS